jgi:hypothetical protein
MTFDSVAAPANAVAKPRRRQIVDSSPGERPVHDLVMLLDLVQPLVSNIRAS